MDLAVGIISTAVPLLHRIPLYFSLKKSLVFSIQSRFSPGSADHQESISCANEYLHYQLLTLDSIMAILQLGSASLSSSCFVSICMQLWRRKT
jgi:hypothetical protein